MYLGLVSEDRHITTSGEGVPPRSLTDRSEVADRAG